MAENSHITGKERPILFSGPMVRALLDGRKTQTRRVVKPQPAANAHLDAIITFNRVPTAWGWDTLPCIKCPYGVIGDHLWVRETFGLFQEDRRFPLQYAADYEDLEEAGVQKWKPSIFMPRAASRLTLEIVSVRVEWVQEISEGDAKAEGASRKIWIDSPLSAGLTNIRSHQGTHREGFKDLWDSINAPRGFGWDVNPWVWVIEFKRVEVAAS